MNKKQRKEHEKRVQDFLKSKSQNGTKKEKEIVSRRSIVYVDNIKIETMNADKNNNIKTVETQQDFLVWLSDLTDTGKIIILMSYLGYKHFEIADVLHLCRRTIDVKINKLLKVFKRKFNLL